MPDLPISQTGSAVATTDEDRRLRSVTDGRADIAAGRIVTPQSIDDWIETVGAVYEQPIPQSAHP